MRKRFKRLQRILDELGLEEDARRYNVESRRDVQAVIFVLQLMQQKETEQDVDLSTQPGYFFKWYDGPYSSRLDETHGKLVDYARYETPTNGANDDVLDASPLVEFAEQMATMIDSPPTVEDRSLWLRTLSIVAYGCVGGNWTDGRVRQAVEKNLGTEWGQYVEDAKARLAQLGLLNRELAEV
jgi:hypothetical protein